MSRPRHALSLVEVMLAVSVLGLALLPVVSLFFTASRESKQTSDYGVALTVGQKVAEELYLASWENLHLAAELEQMSDPDAAPLRDGGSPFFRVLEDQTLPYGELKAGEDPAITPEFGALYRQLKSYRMRVASRVRALPTTGEVVDVELDTRWIDFQEKPRALGLRVPLPRTVQRAEPPAAVADRAAADRAIQETVWPSAAGTALEELARTSSIPIETMRQVGDAVILGRSIQLTEPEHRTRVDELTAAVAAATEPVTRTRLVLARARVHETRAATHLSAMIYLGTTIASLPRLAQGMPSVESSPLGPQLRTADLVLRRLPEFFDNELSSARGQYALAYAPPLGDSLHPRLRVRVFMKLIELTKLRVLTVAPGELALLDRLLASFQEYQEPRNPNFASFARHERTAAVDLPTLRRTATGAWRGEVYRKIADALLVPAGGP